MFLSGTVVVLEILETRPLINYIDLVAFPQSARHASLREVCRVYVSPVQNNANGSSIPSPIAHLYKTLQENPRFLLL